ncbi:MAG: UDP-N-acetylglucosamine--N-acetylmuramyl-(pentapeptide) pyrophosphoryl-undecaprenol N-acetylglucosamine transferase, partial [Armatimonadetes bacterium]|nr:UDP-N-acetylglucosamine--N-acetylmuramyl-(pentapeptide) pyrophosphoryl-undecaprenol N-acetylglucosamine transferase [Armatimonadota bacterium]
MKILLAGGGTGGHIYPALTIAEAAASANPPAYIEFAGDPEGLEGELVQAAGYSLHAARGNPLPRRWSLTSVLALGKLALRVPQSVCLVRRLCPDVVIGTGGYVSANLLLAASLLRIPSIVLELNAIPGRTTRWLANRVTRIALAFDEARQWFPAEKTVVVGVPVRRAILDANRDEVRAQLCIPAESRVLLIFGGSQAAHRINVATFGAARGLVQRFPDLHIIHLCGDTDLGEAEEIGKLLEESERHRYRFMPYCHEMERLLAAADLTVSRSGGSSIGELTARGLPAILVPYPYATDDHQTANARAVAAGGGAVVVADSELDAPRLTSEVTTLLSDDGRLAALARASLSF